uniref:Uncharacterized protein n=1 Tax=Pyramimonas obovata TaxID=1411642 RepID=A0A7S0RUE0_9CHLO|eukprot:CAMPEP_0118936032 /NCGR_PEP_ID=MMETSP1169-20130426/15968_1 /TAXON_ID=36882 /ORGANISM="Pyramimonas obovata, Strain CCMP722" /LENGTH=311 /DNA_ID=CAMNT_0006879129 /DNA_START=97 /DNA_END=1032 /DNA_ORIENTATION=+
MTSLVAPQLSAVCPTPAMPDSSLQSSQPVAEAVLQKEACKSKRVTDFFAAPQNTSENTIQLPLSACKVLKLDEVKDLRDEEVTAEMLVACVAHIRTLEAKLVAAGKRKEPASSTGPHTPAGAKKAKGDATAPAASSAPVSKKQTAMIIKRLITGTKQALKGVKFFKGGYDSTVRDAKTSDMISMPEFEAVFAGGKLIQPTPQNKPGSKVYIKEYTGTEATALLGSAATALKGELWLKGGAPTRGFGGFFGGGGGFSKGKKLGSTPLSITHMKVNYSSNSNQLSVTVSLLNGETGGGLCGGGDSDDDTCAYW